MRKLQEVLRLRFKLKLGYQQIGRSCSIGVSTVPGWETEAINDGELLGYVRGLLAFTRP